MHDEHGGAPDGRAEATHADEVKPAPVVGQTPDVSVAPDVPEAAADEQEAGAAAAPAAHLAAAAEPARPAEPEDDLAAAAPPGEALEQQPGEPAGSAGAGMADPEAVPAAGLSPVPQAEAQPPPAPAVAAPDRAAPEDTTAAFAGAGMELEELTLPSSIPALAPLPAGAAAGPDGRIVVERLREQRGRVNHYLATRTDESGASLPVELLEAPVDHVGLQRQAEVLAQVRYPMLPALYAAWEQDGRRYLAIERLEGPTLAEALAAGMSPDQVASIVLQLAQVLRRLHHAGWVLAGLSPDGVAMGQPIRVTQVGSAMRIGEEPSQALQVPGYSAPELAHRAAITGKEDVYTLGAVLYRGLAGAPVPEQGPELAALATTVRTPGAPQLLAPALAPAAGRIDLEEFYHRLLAFKRRLALAPLALRVASGTSIGLNQTRLANEDACGYLTWCSAYEGRMAYHAVLCAIDGMGGMEAGEVASTAALRAILHEAAAYSVEHIAGAAGSDRDQGVDRPVGEPVAADPSPRSLDPKDLVQAAAAAAYAAARGREVGATITCAVVADGTLTLAHVGDTRAYLLRDGVLTQLTHDHSLVAAMVASGMLTREEARGHPESNKVLRSLGGQRSLPDDHIDGLAVAYGEEVLRLREGDQVLLCSDGVWGVLDDDALLRILSESADCVMAVETAIRRVLEGGAPDNAAIIVARCQVMPAS